MEATKLSTADIRSDDRLRVRQVRQEVVEEYKTILPQIIAKHPIRVFEIDGEYVLTDGGHRLESANQLDWTEISAIVLQGSWSDAVDDACTANAENAVPLTADEKHRAAAMLKEEHFHGGQGSRDGWQPGWSYDRIAGMLGYASGEVVRETISRRHLSTKLISDAGVETEPSSATATKPLEGSERERLRREAEELKESNLSRQEIADKMGLSIHQVKSLLAKPRPGTRARKAMEESGTRDSDATMTTNGEDVQVEVKLATTAEGVEDNQDGASTEIQLTDEEIAEPERFNDGTYRMEHEQRYNEIIGLPTVVKMAFYGFSTLRELDAKDVVVHADDEVWKLLDDIDKYISRLKDIKEVCGQWREKRGKRR